MPDVNGGQMTPLPPTLVQRVGQAVSYVVAGVTPNTWFGPSQPLMPMAPPEVKGRAYDYPFGFNLDTRPRSSEPVSFQQLRDLAASCDVLRLVIETRKDQMGTLEWSIRPLQGKDKVDNDPRVKAITEFFRFPDRQQTWDQWLRSLLEDLFVIDAASIYRRPTKGGSLFALELIDGATIKPLLDDSGRPPLPPSPCFQQILKGIPAVDYTAEELIYAPRNTSTTSPYGYAPVQQVLLTINIAIRRAMHQLEYYREGSQPDAFLGLPKEWSLQQIKDFDTWFQSTMSGQLGARRKLKFMPGEYKYQEAKPPPLKDDYDDYLNRVICYAFSVSPQALVSMMNRATAATAQASAAWEGIIPIMRWVESILTRIIRENFNAPDLEFKFNDDLEQDQGKRAEINTAYAKIGALSLDEVRIAIGKSPIGGVFAKPMVLTATGWVPVDPQEAADLKPPPIVNPLMGHNGGPGGALPGDEPKPGEPKPTDAANPKNANAKTPPDDNTSTGQEPGAKKLAKGFKVQTSSLDRKQVTRAEAKLAAKLGAVLRSVKADVIAQLKTKLKKDAAEDYADDVYLTGFELLVDATETQLAAVATDAGSRIVAQFGQGPGTALFDQVNDDAVDFARERAAEMVGMKWVDGKLVDNPKAEYAITQSTRDDVQRIIADGLKNNVGRDAIIEQMEDAAAFSDERATMIARTEIARANSQGELAAYKDAKESLGLTITKAWMVADSPCDVCDDNAAAGQIELDEDFPSGDDAPPGHPNCRCALDTQVSDPDDNSEDN